MAPSLRTMAALSPLALALVAGCATKTSTTHLWQASDYAAPPMRSVIVFGGGMAEPQRRSLEDGFAAELGERGVSATPSYQLFATLPDTEKARAEVQKRGYDGALVATLRSVKERQSYVPGYYHGGGFWGGYYGPGWGMGYSPGYVVTDEYVTVEASLWDLRKEGGALVWSALTRTMNPSSGRDLTKSLTKEIVPNIADAGLIPRRD